MSDLKYWVAFNRIPGIGRARFSQMETHFGTLERAWNAGTADLKAAGLDARSIEVITSLRPTLSPDGELEMLQRYGVQALTWNDASFPSRLRRSTMYPLCFTSGAVFSRRTNGRLQWWGPGGQLCMDAR